MSQVEYGRAEFASVSSAWQCKRKNLKHPTSLLVAAILQYTNQHIYRNSEEATTEIGKRSSQNMKSIQARPKVNGPIAIYW